MSKQPSPQVGEMFNDGSGFRYIVTRVRPNVNVTLEIIYDPAWGTKGGFVGTSETMMMTEFWSRGYACIGEDEETQYLLNPGVPMAWCPKDARVEYIITGVNGDDELEEKCSCIYDSGRTAEEEEKAWQRKRDEIFRGMV